MAISFKNLVDQVPQLQFLVSNMKTEASQRCVIINNTTIIQKQFLKDAKTLSDVKKIGPILPSSNYFHFLDYLFNTPNPIPKDLCEYLFRELNLNINEFCFLGSERENSRPFIARLFNRSDEEVNLLKTVFPFWLILWCVYPGLLIKVQTKELQPNQNAAGLRSRSELSLSQCLTIMRHWCD